MALTGLSAGHHQLVIEGKPKAGGDAVQQTLDLMFKDPASGGDYQFTFPDGLKSYTAGTRVLQPKNGKVYQCKPFPYSGWCSQPSPDTPGASRQRYSRWPTPRRRARACAAPSIVPSEIVRAPTAVPAYRKSSDKPWPRQPALPHRFAAPGGG